MESLWFLVPAHGREALARACLRQLARTLDELRTGHGIDAHALVMADDGNLDTARELGMGTVDRENTPLGRKWNDGYELALREGVDYVVPCGTDDWVAPEYVADLPAPGEIRCSRVLAMVDETGTRLSRLRIGYVAGHGIRVIPTGLLRRCRRPIEEDRLRAVDTATLRTIRQMNPGVALGYRDDDPLAVVDWKSAGAQLNPYEACRAYFVGAEEDPFVALEGRYPPAALTEMRAVYAPEVTT